jgi:hypothetical protein
VVRSAKHPDRERELEVRIRDRDVLVEHTFDRLLRPRAVGQLAAHDELNRSPDRSGVGVACIDEPECCPCGLHDLRTFVLNPCADLTALYECSALLNSTMQPRSTNLVAFTPSTVGPLMGKEELASLACSCRGSVRLADQRKGLECKLGSVRVADSPRADPASMWLLGFMNIPDSLFDALSTRNDGQLS